MVTDTRDPMINVLANCLDAIEQGEISPAECVRCYPQHEQELWIMLQVVGILHSPPTVPVRPAFRQGARERLLRQILPPPPVPFGVRLRAWWQERSPIRWQLQPVPSMVRVAMALLLMVGAALLSMGGVVLAADDTLPGDRLYAIKLAVEDTRLLVLADAGQARLHMTLAERRVAEMEALADLGRYQETPAVLQRYERHIAGAARAVNRIAVHDSEAAGELVASLDQVLERTNRALNELVAAAPADQRPVLKTAAAVSHEYRIVLATLYPWEMTGVKPPAERLPSEPTLGVAPVRPALPTATGVGVSPSATRSIATAVTAETGTPRVVLPLSPTTTPIPVASPAPSSTPTPVPLPLPATWTPVPISTPVLPTATPGEPTKFPPGLTKTAQPPGLTMPPGLTNTPQPPGLTKTP
jgi:hypothetical protein